MAYRPEVAANLNINNDDDDENMVDVMHAYQGQQHPPREVPTKRKRGRPKKTAEPATALFSPPSSSSSKPQDSTVSNVSAAPPGFKSFAIGTARTGKSPNLVIAPQATYEIRSRNGHAVAHPVQECLEHCYSMAFDESLPVDNDYLKFHHEFIAAQNYNLSSLSLRAQKLQIDRRILQQKLWRLAMAHLAAEPLL